MRRKLFFGFLIFFIVSLAIVALLIPMLSRALAPPPVAGDVASQDYVSPEAMTYVSEFLTERDRNSAADRVRPSYTEVNKKIALDQIEKLQFAVDYMSSIRADSYGTIDQKLHDLMLLKDAQIDDETAELILGLSELHWKDVQEEAKIVLEEVMKDAVRQDTIGETFSRIPGLVSIYFSEEQAEVVTELVRAFIAPNSEYDEIKTEARRQEAREVIEPTNVSFAKGQRVTSKGQILTEEDIEALEQLRLIQPYQNWQDIISAIALVLLLTAVIAWYLINQQADFLNDSRSLILVGILFLLFLISARLLNPTFPLIPYAFPIAAFGMTVAALIGVELAFVFILPLAVLVAYGLPNSLELTIYYILTSYLGILGLRRARRAVSFFRAGAVIAISGAVVILVYRLPLPSINWIETGQLIAVALFNGLASASIALILQYLLAQILDKVTPMQLMDLTRPDHPLLQDLLRDAPGTYQHSLQVANLAEQAARQVGADPLLSRVGALYHDIGKALNPAFFIENHVPGFPNPHDNLDPETSSSTIIRHVTDGLELARKHRLPGQVMDFISEHHGTMITRFQYAKAVVEAEGDESSVAKEKFRYPGPRPQSRESAILMLADGCEARARAERPADENAISAMIRSEIANRVGSEQLDDTHLTLRDLNDIIESFTRTLRSVYHPRVKYPELSAGTPDERIIEISSENGILEVQDTEEKIGVPADKTSSVS